MATGSSSTKVPERETTPDFDEVEGMAEKGKGKETGEEDAGVGKEIPKYPGVDPSGDDIDLYVPEAAKLGLVDILGDESFLKGMMTGWFEKATDKKAVLKAAVNCIFVKPRGVRKMPETSGISVSNREWQGFCQSIHDYIQKNHEPRYRAIVSASPLMARYGRVWPECSEDIESDIMRLAEVIPGQKKRQEILDGTYDPKEEDNEDGGVPLKSSGRAGRGRGRGRGR
jgi:hypothetical protein